MTKTTVFDGAFAAEDKDDEAAPRSRAATFSYFSDLIRGAYPPYQGGPGTAILFTSLDRGCGVSHICSSVASDLGERGSPVLLAEATTLDLLAGSQIPGSFVKRLRPGRVSVLGPQQVCADDLPEVPLPGSAAQVVKTLQGEFPSIVIDAPALSVGTTALLLCGAVQGVIFVARAGQTRTRALTEAQKTFTSLGARVLGCVYNAR